MTAGMGRLFGVADPGPCLDMDATIAEVEWAAAHGCVSLTLPGAVVGDQALPPLWDRYFEPLWSVCVEAGLVLSVHAGHGHRQGELSANIEQAAASGLGRSQVLGAMHDGSNDLHRPGDLAPRRPFWQLFLGGVLDRHPELRLALTELHADWVPATLAHLDERFDRGDLPCALRPSEYWRRSCFVSVSSPLLVEVERRHAIGVDQMLFGTDYVQPESTWPNTLDWIAEAFRDVPEDEARRILGENALSCYRLDRQALAAAAGRIGPKPEEVLGGARKVAPEVVADFDTRAAFSRRPERADPDSLDRSVDEELGLIAGHS